MVPPPCQAPCLWCRSGAVLSGLFQQKCHGTFLEPSGLLETCIPTCAFLAMCSFCLKSSIPTCAFPFGGLEALDEHAANAKWHSTHSWFFQWLRQRQEKAAKPQTFPRWADIAMVGEGPCGLLDVWLRPCNHFVCRPKIQWLTPRGR